MSEANLPESASSSRVEAREWRGDRPSFRNRRSDGRYDGALALPKAMQRNCLSRPISVHETVWIRCREVLNQFGGGLDILIHTLAVPGGRRRSVGVVRCDWQEAFDMNYFAASAGSRLPSIDVAAGSGIIIHISSISAHFLI